MHIPDSTVALGENSGRASRIVLREQESEAQELPAPQALTPGAVVGGTEHRNDPTGE